MTDRKQTMNIRDVALAAGVSVATVSRVLNPAPNGHPMRPETRQRVLDVINELGYRPNALAAALLHRRTTAIGLVLPDISNPYYPALVRGVEDVASEAGYRVVLCNTDRSLQKTNAYLDTLVKTRVDGIIIAGGSSEGSISPALFEPYRPEVVVVGRHDLDYPSVQIDNVGAARTVTDHLLDLGHRSIAFVAGPYASHTVQDRLAGYREALEQRGMRYDEGLVTEGDLQEATGYEAARAMLRRNPRPSALIAANDRMAFGAMAALLDAGLELPRDVSLAGFDDVSLTSFVRPALTTVSVPTYDIGRAAMHLLLDAFDGKRPDEPTMLPTTLMVRGSCGPPRASS